MATVTTRVDDLDGKSKVDGDTTFLTLNGNTVALDLTAKHVTELEATLSLYFEKGTPVELPKGKSNGGKASVSQEEKARNAEVRAWAQANGHKVADRGRLSADVVAAWEAAQVATGGDTDS